MLSSILLTVPLFFLFMSSLIPLSYLPSLHSLLSAFFLSLSRPFSNAICTTTPTRNPEWRVNYKFVWLPPRCPTRLVRSRCSEMEEAH
ncbi:hypothetical protein N657DRAFT_226136 [Parathielavia appendiculata]|uniref:Uncharacterized protein n=1 Tax=Parathielavia appendiculata TaxID=2587402 RepID=A0AAN6U845_9PEZI|nr:hypothetical protein N657DRAFT_226136 [Parathielavia appendiculata]